MIKYILILALFSSCYITKPIHEKEFFIKNKIDLKIKLNRGELTKCEYDWLMLTNYEMYYGQ